MFAEEAIETLGLSPGFLKKWEKVPDKALRIFKLAVKKAYRLRALETHPDRPSGSAEEFRKVGEAYETLQKADKEFITELIESLPSSQPRKRFRKVYVESRGGGKLKVTYISPCGISTSFVNLGVDPNYLSKAEKERWTERLIAAMRGGGLMPSYEEPTPVAGRGELGYKIVIV